MFRKIGATIVAVALVLPEGASAAVVGDVTGDGRDDVVLATSSYSDPAKAFQLYIYAQTPSGKLAAPIQLPYLGIGQILNVRMQITDLDNDGIQDIVVGHDQGITVIMSLGGGRFKTTVTTLPGTLSALAASDLNRDGKIDVVRQNADGGLSILSGDGKGGFASVRTLAATSAWHQALRIADVTGDGLNDMVFTNQLTLTVYPGKGNGDFLAPRIFPYAAADTDTRGYSSVAITDVDHDGRNDILATTSANQPKSALWMYRQASDGNLLAPQRLPTYDIAEALTTADLDHDGYPDLVTMHGGWQAVGFYLQHKQGLAPEDGAYIPYATHYDQNGVATGDLDGDGCTDVAIADYNNGLIILHGQNCYVPTAMTRHFNGDFDGDGIADILWHNVASGASVIWKSGDSAAQVPLTRVTDPRWIIAGVGDFDGDGRSDILWHQSTSGENVLWPSGNYQQSRSLTRVEHLEWEIVGIGDFDGNGRDDILWRNKYSGADVVWRDGYSANTRNLASVTDIDWIVAGVGDFDGDGKDDILWRNRSDGRNAIWRNADYVANQVVATVSDLGWQVAGIGDFDGDGQSDILWRQSFNGQGTIWESANAATRQSLPQVTDLRWKIAGVADYNGDGRSDVLWRHASGANVIWNDARYTTSRAVTGVTNMEWRAAR